MCLLSHSIVYSLSIFINLIIIRLPLRGSNDLYKNTAMTKSLEHFMQSEIQLITKICKGEFPVYKFAAIYFIVYIYELRCKYFVTLTIKAFPTKHLCILVPAPFWDLMCINFSEVVQIMCFFGAIWDKFREYCNISTKASKKHHISCPISNLLMQIMCTF